MDITGHNILKKNDMFTASVKLLIVSDFTTSGSVQVERLKCENLLKHSILKTKISTPREARIMESGVDQSGSRHTVREHDGGRHIELHKMLIIFLAF